MKRRWISLAAVVAVTLVPVEPSAAARPAEPAVGPEGCQIPSDRPIPGSGKIRRVGTEPYPTVSAAVKAAHAGDTILIPPGVYRETVVVADDVDEEGRTTRRRDGLRIRGMDRAGVIFDGSGVANPYTKEPEHQHLESAFLIRSDRVVLENLTVRYYSRDPVAWYGVEGFWGRYLTIYGGGMQNAVSGSRCGQFDHVFASGMATVGLAVTACFPCDTTVVDSVAQDSWIGFAALNSRGGVHIGRPTPAPRPVPENVSRRNNVGILAVTEDPTGPAPGIANEEAVKALTHGSGAGVWISGNYIADNDNGKAVNGGCAPMSESEGCEPRNTADEALASLGIGVYVLGSRAVRIEGNTISDHDRFGIGVVSFPGPAVGNVVVGNRVTGTLSGFDLMQDVSAGPGNCWAGNEGAQMPAQLELVWGCQPGITTPPGGAPSGALCATAVNCKQSFTTDETGKARETWETSRWERYNEDGSAVTDPRAWLNQPDDGNDRSYGNDGGVDEWLPEVRPYCGPGGYATCRT